ncbi:MAG: hypothetical protein IPH20_23190 [Bacteroidales bacterium]|nr:hypothetical protein [Bacteroidales bacterium]
MKTLLLFCLLAIGISLQAQVAVNTDGTAPDNSAMLDVKSTTRGLLAPRMTLVQRNAIVTPATGLIVFQTNGTPGYYYNSGTPAVPAWALVGSNAGQWLTNGTSIYYNLGNVGIGTSTPGQDLDVRGLNTDDGGAIGIGNSDLSHRLILFSGRLNDPNPFINWKQGDPLRFATDEGGWSEKMRITSDGSVGIGTDTPLEKLHIEGDVHLSDSYPFINFNNTSAGGNSGLVLRENGVNKAWVAYRGDVNSLTLNADNSGGWSPDLIVQNGGNVGFGTLAPTANLHVVKNLPKYTALFGDDIQGYNGATTVSIGDNSSTALLYVGQSTVNKGFLLWNYDPTPANAQFWVGTYNGSNPLVLQPVGGRVGVGISAPEANFHVAEGGSSYTGLFGTSISGWTSSTNVSIGDDNAHLYFILGQSSANKGFLYWNPNTTTPSAAYFTLGTFGGTNPLILQEAGGNVGIGTFSPVSRLQIDYNADGHSYLGYSADYPAYLYHVEQVADGDGQANLYALRDRSAQNDGTGYSYYTCNTAINGYSYWGDIYTFGTSGFNYNDLTRCGGVLGAYAYGSYWGSLGYKNSASTTYGGYFTSSANGGGKSQGQADTGIGIGAWGDLMGADIHGKVYGLYAEGENYAMFSNGDVYKNKLDVHLQDNGTGTNTVLYTNVSTDVTVQTSGVATLSSGRANIAFDPSFAASVSSEAPVIVTVTPIGNSNGVYLAEVSGSGFTVVENNAGKSNITVNYIAIGKRAGYENPNLPREVIDAGYTGKLASGLHNDADTETNGEGLYYENGELVVGINPSTLPDPNKPAIETVIPKPSAPSNEGLGVKGISTGAIDPGLIQPKASFTETW